MWTLTLRGNWLSSAKATKGKRAHMCLLLQERGTFSLACFHFLAQDLSRHLLCGTIYTPLIRKTRGPRVPKERVPRLEQEKVRIV
jgi:hypothetical protein